MTAQQILRQAIREYNIDTFDEEQKHLHVTIGEYTSNTGITIGISIPPGNWTDKRFSEMSEEECVPLVPAGGSSVEHMVEPEDLTGFVKSVDSYGRDKWTKVTSVFYKDFTKKPHHRAMNWTAKVPTAKESLSSLIRSHGLDPERTLVLTEI